MATAPASPRHALRPVVGCLFASMLLAAPGLLYAQGLARYEFSAPKMGTVFRIVLFAPDSVTARRAADAAFARVDTLNAHLSDYLPESELNRLSATSGSGRDVHVSEDLWRVLDAAQHLAERTEGAFDVTVGPFTRLWRRARRRNELPSAEALASAREAVGYGGLRLDAANRTVRLDRPGMRLDLGGIAKGYAVDEALEVLRTLGLARALVDGGGDVRLGDPPPGRAGWRIAVSRVSALAGVDQDYRDLARCAIATSGDTFQFVEVDGVRYSHLLDPRTGLGMTDQRLVTVVAPTGMEADALASALSVWPPRRGLDLLDAWPGASGRIIRRQDGAFGQVQSGGFPE